MTVPATSQTVENTYRGERVIRSRRIDEGDLLVVMTRHQDQQPLPGINVWLNDIRFRPANEQEAEELFLDLVQTCRRHFARRTAPKA
jgi:hypothetical protein